MGPIVSSNLVFSEWERIFANPMATAAAIDRVVHHSVILEFDVPSYRTNAAQQRVQAEEVNRALPQQNRYPTQVVASNKMLPKIGEAIAWEEASARWQNRNCWRRSETATELHPGRRKAGFSTSSSRN